MEKRYGFHYQSNLKEFAEKYFKVLLKKDNLHQWKSLKQLNLWMYDDYIASILIPFTDFIIQRLRDIQGIKLVCTQSSSPADLDINGKVLQTFVERITRYLPHLTKLELLIDGIKGVNNLHVERILREILKNLSKLEILSLRIDNCPLVTQKCFQTFGFHSQRYLPRLRKLRLSFEEEKLPPHNFKFDVFFPKLQSLHLNLTNYFSEIEDEKIPALCFCIGQMSTLKKLHIDFSECRGMADDGLKSFGEEICRKNTNLIELIVTFKSCALLTDAGIVPFANELGENLKNLERLELNFSRRLNKLTKRGCLVRMERFHEGGKLITDASLKAIGEALSKDFHRLQYLELHFDGCDEVTNKGLEYLVQAIEKNKKSLKKVRLSFDWCESDSLHGEYVEEIRKKFRKDRCNFMFQLDWINKKKYFDENPSIFD